jgi:DNA gyrase subunit B
MTGEYDDDNIRVLEGLEAVRVRPGMYIGSTGPRGLHHLVYEVVDNSIEEALAGYCKNIDVSINANGSITIADDGRGIPTGINPQTGKSTIETLLTVLCGCERGESGDYKISGWLHGAGTAVVSALSSQLEVKVWRNQKIHTQCFERGIAVSELEIVPSENARTGTSITFLPDSEIFKDSIEFDFDTLAHRFRELAYLNVGMRSSLCDYRLEALKSDKPKVEHYYYEGGLLDYIADLNRDKQPLNEEVIYIRAEKDRVLVEVALQWCIDAEQDCVLGFANTIRTIDGGAHLDGLKIAVTRAVNKIARQRNKLQPDDANLGGESIRDGLTAIVSLLLPNPEWEGSTRTKVIPDKDYTNQPGCLLAERLRQRLRSTLDLIVRPRGVVGVACRRHNQRRGYVYSWESPKLANSEVRGIVDSIVSEVLSEYFAARPDVADAIIERAIKVSDADRIRKRERDLLRRKSQENDLHPS